MAISASSESASACPLIRLAANSVVAALLLPPPRPAATGIFLLTPALSVFPVRALSRYEFERLVSQAGAAKFPARFSEFDTPSPASTSTSSHRSIASMIEQRS